MTEVSTRPTWRSFRDWVFQGRTEHPAPKTYDYLRLAMATLVVVLGAAVVIEWWETGRRCLQTSISAYYYTPASAIFVGALVVVGVCMMALKGSTEAEDILLNLAGMLAPIVALVPTPSAGSCFSVRGAQPDVDANVANNIPAVFVAGLAGLCVVGGLAWRRRSEVGADRRLAYGFGLGLAVIVLVGGFVWFLADRSGFIGNAHYTAAVPMFVFIVLVVVINALDSGAKYRAKYAAIAGFMVAAPAVMWLVSTTISWDHRTLWIEATLLLLFVVFWALQTKELWAEGVRPEQKRQQL